MRKKQQRINSIAIIFKSKNHLWIQEISQQNFVDLYDPRYRIKQNDNKAKIGPSSSMIQIEAKTTETLKSIWRIWWGIRNVLTIQDSWDRATGKNEEEEIPLIFRLRRWEARFERRKRWLYVSTSCFKYVFFFFFELLTCHCLPTRCVEEIVSFFLLLSFTSLSHFCLIRSKTTFFWIKMSY